MSLRSLYFAFGYSGKLLDYSCARNRKVELQKKMELSLGVMLYPGYFLNHLQPTNDHEISFCL